MSNDCQESLRRDTTRPSRIRPFDHANPLTSFKADVQLEADFGRELRNLGGYKDKRHLRLEMAFEDKDPGDDLLQPPCGGYKDKRHLRLEMAFEDKDPGDDLLREPCKAIKDKTPPSFDGRVCLL